MLLLHQFAVTIIPVHNVLIQSKLCFVNFPEIFFGTWILEKYVSNNITAANNLLLLTCNLRNLCLKVLYYFLMLFSLNKIDKVL